MLRIEGLRKVFESTKHTERVVAVDGISLEVDEGQFFTLLGPSGCGKTTMLRSVAGLERPDEGEIAVNGKTHFSSSRGIDVEAHKRGLGMVFQSYAIWPHMTVRQNVAYPLRVGPRGARLSSKMIEERVQRVLEVVQLGDLLARPATDLSGGQQQRLALARALVAEPPLLLLDEPLSNLDAKLREEMRLSLRELQQEFAVTTIYVTHDQNEALAMSDLIAVMNQGRVEQLGAPEEIYSQPASKFVAEFIGTSNFLEGRVMEAAERGWRVATSLGELVAVSSVDFAAGETVTVSVRPEGVELTAEEVPATKAVGVWPGQIRTRAFLGESVDHLVDVGGGELLVRSHQSTNIPMGSTVGLSLHRNACTIVPA